MSWIFQMFDQSHGWDYECEAAGLDRTSVLHLHSLVARIALKGARVVVFHGCRMLWYVAVVLANYMTPAKAFTKGP